MRDSAPLLVDQPPSLPPARGRRRWLRLSFGLYALGLLGLPWAVYQEENWRGARAWAACRRELEARGERLDLAAFVPPEVPDGRNLAMAPLFARLLSYQTEPGTGRVTMKPPAETPIGLERPPGMALGGADYGRHVDLAAYQRALAPTAGAAGSTPAEAVLKGLESSGPLLAELAQAAAERPLSRFPVHWQQALPAGIALPHLNVEQQLVQALALRASAGLAAGRTDDAARDVQLCLRLCRDAGAEPDMIAYLVQITCLRIVMTPIWEGLADRRWSPAQLQSLQQELGGFNALGSLLVALRSERAAAVKTCEFIKRRPDRWKQLFSIMHSEPPAPGASLSDYLYQLAPDGWFDLNKVSQARFMQDCLIAAIDAPGRKVSLARFALAGPEIARLRASRIHLLTSLSIPIFESVVRRGVKTEATLVQAVTACALERFFHERHVYPAQLAELAPAFLDRAPLEVIDGGPLRYATTPDGRYQIYSPGWNGRDDGGKVVWSTPRTLDLSQGDWPWQYTAVQPEPPATKR